MKNRTYSTRLLVHPLRCHLIGLMQKLDAHGRNTITIQGAADYLLAELEKIDKEGGQ